MPHRVANFPLQVLRFAGVWFGPGWGLTCSPLRAVSTPSDRSPRLLTGPQAGPLTRRTATPRGGPSQAGAGLRFDCPRGPRERPCGDGMIAFRPAGRPQPNCHVFAVLRTSLYGFRHIKPWGCNQLSAVERGAMLSLTPTPEGCLLPISSRDPERTFQTLSNPICSQKIETRSDLGGDIRGKSD